LDLPTHWHGCSASGSLGLDHCLVDCGCVCFGGERVSTAGRNSGAAFPARCMMAQFSTLVCLASWPRTDSRARESRQPSNFIHTECGRHRPAWESRVSAPDVHWWVRAARKRLAAGTIFWERPRVVPYRATCDLVAAQASGAVSGDSLQKPLPRRSANHAPSHHHQPINHPASTSLPGSAVHWLAGRLSRRTLETPVSLADEMLSCKMPSPACRQPLIFTLPGLSGSLALQRSRSLSYGLPFADPATAVNSFRLPCCLWG
jgi:hypothetical protein